MLTPKQKELLMFIAERMNATGVPPSFDEMKEALDLKSKSGIHRLVMALEERGFIRRLPHRARALEIVKMPEIGGEPDGGARRFQPELIEGGRNERTSSRSEGSRRQGTSSSDHTATPAVTVPVMGRIAAGVPISAIETHAFDIEVPPDMIGGGEHYALEVKGDSMIEAGIMDGDVVVIRRTNTAQNGDIVVALVDQEEATLKRLRKRGGEVALEAANPAYETRTFGPDRVDVQGRLVGLIRRY